MNHILVAKSRYISFALIVVAVWLSHRKVTTNATLASITQAESEMGVVAVISVNIIAVGKVRDKE